MDGWMDGYIDKYVDRQIGRYTCISACIYSLWNHIHVPKVMHLSMHVAGYQYRVINKTKVVRL